MRVKQSGAGRPELEIDWEKADDLLMKGCNGVQVAAYFDVHPDTLYNRCVSEKGTNFSDYSQKLRQKGNTFLHQKQYEVAQEGNTTMLVWLGKQRLDQKENKEKELPENLEKVYLAMLEELAELREQLREERKKGKA